MTHTNSNINRSFLICLKHVVLYLLVYLLNYAYLLNYKCKINKKDEYLNYLNKIYMLKCISKNIVFICIPFKPRVFIELQV